MTRPVRFASWTVALAAVALLLPGMAAGQADEARAAHHKVLDRMHDEALAGVWSSTTFTGALREAAAMHQEVALLRPEHDPRRSECFTTQAQLLAAIGDQDGARWFLESAALHAQASGDILTATLAYIDAAIIAADAKNYDRANYLRQQVKQIVDSDLLSPTERDVVRVRIKGMNS